MWPVVEAAFPSFTTRFEGSVNCMYLDVKGLVTIGVGCLIDPVMQALGLPFLSKSTGARVSRDSIAAEWRAVKVNTYLASQGWRSAAAVTSLMLSPDSVDELLVARLRSNDAYLSNRFGGSNGWEQLPADAQLAVHSMAWACGPAFHFPRFEAALLARDFETCARECHLDDSHNAGLTPRNAANAQLFLNAASVVADGSDPSVLLYARG